VAFHDSIVTGRPPPTSGRDGLRDVILCQAIIDSHHRSAPVDYPTVVAGERAAGERVQGERAQAERPPGERVEGERAPGERVQRERAQAEPVEGEQDERRS
jgi:hypothetical protein